MTPLSENVCFSLKFSEFLGKSTNSTHGKRAPFSQISQKWRPFSENVRFSPKLSDFRKNNDFPEKILDFPETIPAYLNFAAAHIFFVYPKKLSYSSRNAYIKKIRVRELASSLLKNLKHA